MQFVRTEHRAAARKRCRMGITRSAFGREQVIPPVLFKEMRPLGNLALGPRKNFYGLADQPLLFRIVFLQKNAAEPLAVTAIAVIPMHVNKILFPVVVMKERRIEPASVQIDGLAPLPIDMVAAGEIIFRVFKMFVCPLPLIGKD